MSCPKEINCAHNLELRNNSLCNYYSKKDKPVVCNYKDNEFARENCGEFREIVIKSPDIVVLDVSDESHEEIVECLEKTNLSTRCASMAKIRHM